MDTATPAPVAHARDCVELNHADLLCWRNAAGIPDCVVEVREAETLAHLANLHRDAPAIDAAGLPATVWYVYSAAGSAAGIAAGPFPTYTLAADYDPTDDRLQVARMPFLTWVCLTTDRDDIRGHVPEFRKQRDADGIRTHSTPAELCAGCTAHRPEGVLVPVSFCATALAVATARDALDVW